MKDVFVSGKELDGILEDIPTPFYLYDEQGIRRTVRKLQNAFAWNPGYKQYFAVKAAPTPALLKIMKEEGCGADCASLSEVLLAQKCGFAGKDIVFSSNDTPAEDYRCAYGAGAVINLDDISHIPFLEKILGSLPPVIACRYNPGGLLTLGKTGGGFQVMDEPQESKFGMTEEQIFEAFRLLKDRGVREFGLHAFLASNTLSGDYYPYLAEQLFDLAVRLHKETQCRITFIDLSGGIGIPYRPEDRENDIDAIAQGVRKAYEEILVPADMGDIAVWTELGRYITGPHGILVTKVIHLKHTYKDYAGTDSGMQDLMRPAMYGACHHITVHGKENEPCTHLYDVTGSLCENNDRLAKDRLLPELSEGDVLIVHDAGAHGHAMGFSYNGKLRCAEYLYTGSGTVRLIRRRQTPQDLFQTLVWDE